MNKGGQYWPPLFLALLLLVLLAAFGRAVFRICSACNEGALALATNLILNINDNPIAKIWATLILHQTAISPNDLGTFLEHIKQLPLAFYMTPFRQRTFWIN